MLELWVARVELVQQHPARRHVDLLSIHFAIARYKTQSNSSGEEDERV